MIVEKLIGQVQVLSELLMAARTNVRHIWKKDKIESQVIMITMIGPI